MTIVAALIVGSLAGFFVRRKAAAYAVFVAVYAAVLAFQTWVIGSGHGNSPSSTVHESGYWFVQIVSLVVGLGLVWLAGWLREKRSGNRPASVERPAV